MNSSKKVRKTRKAGGAAALARSGITAARTFGRAAASTSLRPFASVARPFFNGQKLHILNPTPSQSYAFVARQGKELPPLPQSPVSNVDTSANSSRYITHSTSKNLVVWVPKINPYLYLAHYERYKRAIAVNTGKVPSTNNIRSQASNWLDMVAYKSTNMILEKLAILSVGTYCKVRGAAGQGANSGCGRWEAKPMRTKLYTAAISADSATSLKRHQTIPFIVLLGATEDGGEILWAITTSYRVFDTSRFNALVSELKKVDPNPDIEAKFSTLPDDLEGRWRVLSDLEKAAKGKVSIKGNRLPIKDLEGLQPGSYEVWVNPGFKDADYSATDKAKILALNERQGRGMSQDFVKKAIDESFYFDDKIQNKKTGKGDTSAEQPRAAQQKPVRRSQSPKVELR